LSTSRPATKWPRRVDVARHVELRQVVLGAVLHGLPEPQHGGGGDHGPRGERRHVRHVRVRDVHDAPPPAAALVQQQRVRQAGAVVQQPAGVADAPRRRAARTVLGAELVRCLSLGREAREFWTEELTVTGASVHNHHSPDDRAENACKPASSMRNQISSAHVPSRRLRTAFAIASWSWDRRPPR
jgi:hypothetical protein